MLKPDFCLEEKMGFFSLPSLFHSWVEMLCWNAGWDASIGGDTHLRSNRLQSQRHRTSLQDGEEEWGEGILFQHQYTCQNRRGNVTATQFQGLNPIFKVFSLQRHMLALLCESGCPSSGSLPRANPLVMYTWQWMKVFAAAAPSVYVQFYRDWGSCLALYFASMKWGGCGSKK